MGLFRGVVLSGARAFAKRRAVKADTGPAGAHELADIAMAFTCRFVQHLLVVLGKQTQSVGFGQVAVLGQGKYPA